MRVKQYITWINIKLRVYNETRFVHRKTEMYNSKLCVLNKTIKKQVACFILINIFIKLCNLYWLKFVVF